MTFWKSKRVTVTGGKGFLGKYIIEKLQQYGCINIAIADLPEYNLTKITDIQRMYYEQQPDIVIHLAAVVGGIEANRTNPGKFFFDNANDLNGAIPVPEPMNRCDLFLFFSFRVKSPYEP